MSLDDSPLAIAMSIELMKKYEKEILELVNASAQTWQEPEESQRLLQEAKRLAQLRNRLAACNHIWIKVRGDDGEYMGEVCKLCGLIDNWFKSTNIEEKL